MKNANKLVKLCCEKLDDGEFEDGVCKKKLGYLVEVGKVKQLKHRKICSNGSLTSRLA